MTTKGIKNLSGIKVSGKTVKIGATTKHVEEANTKDVKKTIPSLAVLAEGIGDPQVRNRGTIGGSIANNDPSADYPSACIALNAVIKAVHWIATRPLALLRSAFNLGINIWTKAILSLIHISEPTRPY